MDFLFGGARRLCKKSSKRCKKGGEETHFNETAEDADFKDAQISDLKTVKALKPGEYDEKRHNETYKEAQDYKITDDVKIEKKDVEGATPQAGGKRRRGTKKPVKKTVKRSNKKGGNCSLASSSTYPFESAIVSSTQSEKISKPGLYKDPEEQIGGRKKRKSVKKPKRKTIRKGGEGEEGEEGNFDENNLYIPDFSNEAESAQDLLKIEGGARKKKRTNKPKPKSKGGSDDYASIVGGKKKAASKKCCKGGNTVYESEGGGKGKKGKGSKGKKGGVINLTPFISALALFSARMYSEQSKTKASKAKASKSKTSKK